MTTNTEPGEWEQEFLNRVRDWTQTQRLAKFDVVTALSTYETDWSGDTFSGFSYRSALEIHGQLDGHEHVWMIEGREVMDLWRFLMPMEANGDAR